MNIRVIEEDIKIFQGANFSKRIRRRQGNTYINWSGWTFSGSITRTVNNVSSLVPFSITTDDTYLIITLSPSQTDSLNSTNAQTRRSMLIGVYDIFGTYAGNTYKLAEGRVELHRKAKT